MVSLEEYKNHIRSMSFPRLVNEKRSYLQFFVDPSCTSPIDIYQKMEAIDEEIKKVKEGSANFQKNIK